jgi:hypothetical protein
MGHGWTARELRKSMVLSDLVVLVNRKNVSNGRLEPV